MKEGVFKKFLMLIVALLLSIFAPQHAQAEVSGDYTYTISGTEATITDYSGYGGSLVILETLDGYKVTAILNMHKLRVLLCQIP